MNLEGVSSIHKKLCEYSHFGSLRCEWECQVENSAKIARFIGDCELGLVYLSEKNEVWFDSRLDLNLSKSLLKKLIYAFDSKNKSSEEIYQLTKITALKDHPYIFGDPFFEYFVYITLFDNCGGDVGKLCLLGSKKGFLVNDQWLALKTLGEQIHFTLESKRQQEQFKVSQEVASIGNWSFDVLNEKIYWSEELFNIFGLDPLSKEPSMLEHLENQIHPEDRELWLSCVTRSMEVGEPYEMEFRGVKPLGEIIWLKAFGQAFKDELGRVVSLSGTCQDITEAKLLIIENEKISTESRRLLEEQKRFLTNTLNNIPAVFYAKDLEGRLISVNSSFKKLYNLSEDQIIGKTDHELFEPKIADVFRRNDLDVINQKMVIESEEGAIGGDGKYRLYHSYKFPYFDKNGEVIATGGISLDITEKKDLERQAFMNSKLASVGELAAGVGHEINNPLAIIKGYIETIQYSLVDGGADIKVLSEYLTKVDSATDRIAKIVQGLRRFARSDSDAFEELELGDAIYGPVDMVKDIYKNEGVNISFDSNPIKGVTVYGSLGKLQQVFMNLLSNARDATIGQDKRCIDISTMLLGDKVRVVVKDNGSGIPGEIKNKIFDPFFSTKEVNKGSGIGLSIVHKVVEEHKGKILCDSEEHVGTTFTLDFPILNRTAKAFLKSSAKDMRSEAITAKEDYVDLECSAILADDEEDIREILQGLLEDMGVSVEAVENGKDAYDLYSETENYDLIISDMKMPVMDGMELLKKVRLSSKIKKQPKIIMITGGINVNFEDKDTEFGQLIDGYLLKPFNKAEIKKVISEVMGKSVTRES